MNRIISKERQQELSRLFRQSIPEYTAELKRQQEALEKALAAAVRAAENYERTIAAAKEGRLPGPKSRS